MRRIAAIFCVFASVFAALVGFAEEPLAKRADHMPLVVDLWPGETPGDAGIEGEESTPPILLAHSSDDSISDAEHSVFMYLALKRAGIPAELHIYASGDHDFGVRQNEKLPSSWPGLCLKWLESRGLFTPGGGGSHQGPE